MCLKMMCPCSISLSGDSFFLFWLKCWQTKGSKPNTTGYWRPTVLTKKTWHERGLWHRRPRCSLRARCRFVNVPSRSLMWKQALLSGCTQKEVFRYTWLMTLSDRLSSKLNSRTKLFERKKSSLSQSFYYSHSSKYRNSNTFIPSTRHQERSKMYKRFTRYVHPCSGYQFRIVQTWIAP